MADMQSFKIIPVLGRKVDVPADDPTLFKHISDTVALTHDVGGVNFSLQRKRNACTKSLGYVEWSNTANATATKCLGLFMLYDGTNRDHIFFDNGVMYAFDASLNPIDVSPAVTLATDNIDLYSMIRVGSYIVFADRAEHTPYKWKNGDAAATKLIDPSAGSGYTEYKFRYLAYFQNKIVGFYSTQANGDLEVRWTTTLPDLSGDVEFAAANQLYCPSGDSITGAKPMGADRCYIYGENSISQLIYMPDYTVPFRIYTVNSKQGAENHHSIINTGDSHFLFNRNYGFCEFKGGNQLIPISQDIEADIAGMNSAAYNLIVGTEVPLTREIVWTVPMAGSSTPNRLLFYNLDTQQWTWEDKAMRYIDSWLMYQSITWTELLSELGGATALWTAAGTELWAYYLSQRQQLVYANTDGKLYYQSSEGLKGTNLDFYRIEPIFKLGDKQRAMLLEIWFDIVEGGSYSIDVHYRGGNTVKEVGEATWTALPSVSTDNPEHAVSRTAQNNYYHQIKWGTNLVNEKVMVNGITFKYTHEGSY